MNTDNNTNNNNITVCGRSGGGGGYSPSSSSPSPSYTSYDFSKQQQQQQQQPYTVQGNPPILPSPLPQPPLSPLSSGTTTLTISPTTTTYNNSNITYANGASLGGDMRIISISEDKVTDKILGKMMKGNIKVLIPLGKEETDDEYMECTLADLLKTGLLKFHQL